MAYITQYRAHCKDCGSSAVYFTQGNRDDWAYAHPRFEGNEGHEVRTTERKIRP